MAEAALLLSVARAEVAAERGGEAVRGAKAALDAFKKINDASGVAEASLVVVSALTLNGQATDAASMIAELAGKTKEQKVIRQLDVLKVDALLVQGREAEALKLAETVQKSSEAAGDKQNAGKALLASVKVHLATDKSKPAVEAAEKAAACFNAAGDDRGEAAAWTSVMTARFAANDYEGGTSASYAALALYGEIGDKLGEAFVLLKFSQAQIKKRFFSEALSAATHALSFLRKNGGGKLELEALDVAVRAYASTGQGSEAVSLAKQSVASARRSGSKCHEGLALQCLARAHAIEKWADAAHQAASDALSIFQQLGDKKNEASTLQVMARVNHSGFWFEAAQEAAENASRLCQELGDDEGVAAMQALQTEIGETSVRETENQLEVQQTWETRRELDLLILSECAYALKSRDKEVFREKYDQIRDSKTLGKQDFNSAMGEAPDDQIWFYSNIGHSKKGGAQHHMIVDHQPLYQYFRQTGMHYGPGFRLNNYVGANGQNRITSDTYGLLTLYAQGLEQNHSWEGLSWYHAGILDCGLQCGATRAFMKNPVMPGDEAP